MSYACCVAIGRNARVIGEISTKSNDMPGELTLPSLRPLVWSYVPIATCIAMEPLLDRDFTRGSAIGDSGTPCALHPTATHARFLAQSPAPRLRFRARSRI